MWGRGERNEWGVGEALELELAARGRLDPAHDQAHHADPEGRVDGLGDITSVVSPARSTATSLIRLTPASSTATSADPFSPTLARRGTLPRSTV